MGVAWITDPCAESIPPPVPVSLSFMAPVIVSKCSEDAFHFIVHIHTPNSHTLLLKESLQNDSFCLDSFLIKVGKIIRNFLHTKRMKKLLD